MMLSGQRIMILNWILGWLTWNVFAQVQPDCDYRYYLDWGQQHILKSPGYDQGFYYGPGKVCRWAYQSPPGTVLSVSCNPFNIPNSEGCYEDRFVISPSGDPVLADGQNFCGSGTIQMQSYTNAITLGLISSYTSRGERYQCVIAPISGGGPPTPPTSSTTSRPNSCDCGWRQQRRIVGGVETKVNEYAFMAGLMDIPRDTLWCGATIISEFYAVTAAHCVFNKPYTQFQLLVGDHNLAQPSETSSARRYRLSGYRTHESYDERTHENDIGILRTLDRIVFSLEVGPICLPYRYTNLDFTGATVTTMGWGSQFFSGPKSDTLQHVNLTVVSKSKCQSEYQEEIFNSQVCTLGEDKDACTFDSGGPVVWFDDFNTFRYQLIGIISYGRDCATDAPGVNTKVPSYVSWIINQTPDAPYCFL